MALRPTEENKRKLLAISTFSRQMCWYVTKKSLTLELHLPSTSELFIFDALVTNPVLNVVLAPFLVSPGVQDEETYGFWSLFTVSRSEIS